MSNDCDEEIDESAVDLTTWYFDRDNDGHRTNDDTITDCAQPDGYVSSGNDCDDENNLRHPNAEQTCTGIDDNCDGNLDENEVPSGQRSVPLTEPVWIYKIWEWVVEHTPFQLVEHRYKPTVIKIQTVEGGHWFGNMPITKLAHPQIICGSMPVLCSRLPYFGDSDCNIPQKHR